MIVLSGCVPAFIEYEIQDERFLLSESNPRSFVADYDGISIQLEIYSRARAERMIHCKMKIHNEDYQVVSYDISQFKIHGNEGVYHVSMVMVGDEHHSTHYVTNINKDESKEIICEAWNDYADSLSVEGEIRLGEISFTPSGSSIDLGSIRYSLKR